MLLGYTKCSFWQFWCYNPIFSKQLSTGAHCAFSPNLFHGQITQISLNQISSPKNKKCSPWKVFGINYPHTPHHLSRRGYRCPEARLPQHYIGPKMMFCHFSNFCKNKFPGLKKENLICLFTIYVNLRNCWCGDEI